MGKTFRRGNCREGRYTRKKEVQRVYLVLGDPTTEHHIVRVVTTLRKRKNIRPDEPYDEVSYRA